jgi:hypothetical protein
MRTSVPPPRRPRKAGDGASEHRRPITWTAVIDWHDTGQEVRFRAVARAGGGADAVVLGHSDPLDWPPTTDAAVLRLGEAVDELEAELLTAGWRAVAPGERWYERRFAWVANGTVSPPIAQPGSRVLDRPPRPPPQAAAVAADRPAGERVEEAVAGTARVRLLVSALSLASLACGGMAAAAGASEARLAFLMVFCLVGIGSAPWQRNAAMRLPARLTLTALTGVAVLTFVPAAMLTLRIWQPTLAFLAVAAVCAPLHAVASRAALGELRSARGPRRPLLRGDPRLAGLAVAGAACCVVAAAAHRHLDPAFYGFLGQVGPLWYAGLAVLLVTLVAARGDEEQDLALPVVLLVVVLTLTPALVYDGPRSQSAAKHVDLVDQIRTFHALVSTRDIYNDWFGFFVAMAWLCDVTGIRDPMRLATFWPALIALFRVAALRFLFGQLLQSPRRCWAAVALAVLADSLGADYFSPQSVGFLVGLAAFGVALSWYPAALRLSLLLVAGCVLAISHQLSPYIVGGVLAVLVAFRQVRPWWTPLLILGPAVIWAVTHSGALAGYLSLDAIGRTHNFRPPQTIGSVTLERLPVVQHTVLAVLAGLMIVGVLAAIGLARHRRERRAWALACAPGVGLVVVAFNAYGQEGVFRATLFGLPWLAALGAWCAPARPSVRARVGMLAVAVSLTSAFLISSFGLDAINVIRPGDVAAVRAFDAAGGARPATVHYALALGAGDLPTTLPSRRGGHESLRPDALHVLVRQQPVPRPDADMRRLTAALLRFSQEPATRAKLYVVWSPVASDYDWAYGLQTPGQAEEVRDAFLRAPYWKVVLRENGTVLLRFDASRYPADGR